MGAIGVSKCTRDPIKSLSCIFLQSKLPWIKIKGFEKWFWATFKQKWVDSSSAATVLAREYVTKLRKDMSWSKTTAEIEEKVKPCFVDASNACIFLPLAARARTHDADLTSIEDPVYVPCFPEN